MAEVTHIPIESNSTDVEPVLLVRDEACTSELDNRETGDLIGDEEWTLVEDVRVSLDIKWEESEVAILQDILS